MSLESTKYTIEEVAKRYGDFYAPVFEVTIDGIDIVKQKQVMISSITVETSVEPAANTVQFSVSNAFDWIKRDFNWLDDLFVPGKKLEVKMGYKDKLKTMFYGIISNVEANYLQDESPTIGVSGMDMSTLMMKGENFRSWNDKTYSEVVKEVASVYVPSVSIDDTGEKIGTIVQYEMSDFDFLKYLAETCNYDFFIVGKKLYFRKPMTAMTPVLTLSYGLHMNSFNLEMDLSEQVTKVTVRGWDDDKQEPIVGSSDKVVKLGSNSKVGKDLLKPYGDFELQVMANVDSVNEAKAKAEALMNRRAMMLISGEGECIGIPEIKSGRYIRLDGLSEKLNQPYYVTASKHRIDASGYTTSFNVAGNAV